MSMDLLGDLPTNDGGPKIICNHDLRKNEMLVKLSFSFSIIASGYNFYNKTTCSN